MATNIKLFTFQSLYPLFRNLNRRMLMVEIFDNLTQFLAAFIACLLSSILYLRSRRQPYFLLACFYGCFMLSGIYWMLYTILITDSPPMFYVADIGWISGYLFLYLLQDALSDSNERAFKCRSMWLAPLIEIPLTAYFISIGTVIYNLITGGIFLTLVLRSVRGFVYQRKQPGSKKWYFHFSLLCFLMLENCLWLSSYPWVSDTLTNPYFWIDFTVTASLFCMLPAVRKAVNQ